MVAIVPAADAENIRTRVPAAVKKRWDAMLDEHRISQQDAVLSLIEWCLDEDPLTRAMVFRQVPSKDRAELSRIVLRRLASSKAKGGV